MTKPVIDDAMVERAFKAWDPKNITRGDIRIILEAALNPPPEPEIEVTKAMVEAGESAISPYETLKAPCSTLVLAYRAMHKARPETVPNWTVNDDRSGKDRRVQSQATGSISGRGNAYCVLDKHDVSGGTPGPA